MFIENQMAYKKCNLLICVSGFFYRSESNGMSGNIIIALSATNSITIILLVGLLFLVRKNNQKLLYCKSSSNSTRIHIAREEKDNKTENEFQNGMHSETESFPL